MAVKTITIDTEAYDVLARHKRRGQSFSQVIKERLGARCTGRDLSAVLSGLNPSRQTLDAIDSVIRARRLSRASRAKL